MLTPHQIPEPNEAPETPTCEFFRQYEEEAKREFKSVGFEVWK